MDKNNTLTNNFSKTSTKNSSLMIKTTYNNNTKTNTINSNIKINNNKQFKAIEIGFYFKKIMKNHLFNWNYFTNHFDIKNFLFYYNFLLHSLFI